MYGGRYRRHRLDRASVESQRPLADHILRDEQWRAIRDGRDGGVVAEVNVVKLNVRRPAAVSVGRPYKDAILVQSGRNPAAEGDGER